MGTIWVAIPKNHDLSTGPVSPVIVLFPGAGSGDFVGDGITTIGLKAFPTVPPASRPPLFRISEVFADHGLNGWGEGFGFQVDGIPGVTRATTLDNNSSLEFTSGGVDYLGVQLLEHEDGVGTIWLGLPKNHDLDVGPVTPVIVLAPDVVTPQ